MNFACVTAALSFQIYIYIFLPFEHLKWLYSVIMEWCIEDLLLIICSIAGISYDKDGEEPLKEKTDAESQGHISLAQHVLSTWMCSMSLHEGWQNSCD